MQDWFIECVLTGDDRCAKINAQNVLCYFFFPFMLSDTQ